MKSDEEQIIKCINRLMEIENVLGKFELKENLGQGGTSIVRKTICNGHEFAIKFLITNVANKDSRYLRFKQAYINISNIQHIGGIVPLLFFDEIKMQNEEGQDVLIPYIIMRKTDDVFSKFYKEKEIMFDEFEIIFKRLISIIEYIHQYGVIHRDIKPENIFIINGKLYLGDFDIAKFDDEEHIRLRETKDKERLANLLFSAPEQSDSKIGEVSPASDWYAFAQVMHWLMKKVTVRGLEKIELDENDIRFKKYNLLLERLLQQNPQERLQSYDDINTFLIEKDEDLKRQNEEYKRLQDEQETVDAMWKSVITFDEITSKYTAVPLKTSMAGIVKINDNTKINDIMSFLGNNIKTLDLIVTYYDSEENRNLLDFPIFKRIMKIENNVWVFDIKEINIDFLYIYKHSISLGGSFIIIKSKTMTSSGLYPEETKYEEVAFYDGKYISINECQSGWTEENGELVDIREKAEIRCRYLNDSIFFLAPKKGPLYENEDILSKIYFSIKNNGFEVNDEIEWALLHHIKRDKFLLRYD